MLGKEDFTLSIILLVSYSAIPSGCVIPRRAYSAFTLLFVQHNGKMILPTDIRKSFAHFQKKIVNARRKLFFYIQFILPLGHFKKAEIIRVFEHGCRKVRLRRGQCLAESCLQTFPPAHTNCFQPA